MWHQPFEKKDNPWINVEQGTYCCQLGEIGGWGGDKDSFSRHATYEEALERIKEFQTDYTTGHTGYKILTATTLDTQRNARKALRDRGFKTTKAVQSGYSDRKIFFHYWAVGMPTERELRKRNET